MEIEKIDKDVPLPSAGRSKERAPTRAAEAREPRRRRVPGWVDKYYIPADAKPEGVSFEWKRLETFGQPDPSYQANLGMNGWEAVKAEDFPEIAKSVGVASGSIIRDGLILMERPQSLTNEARLEDTNAAREAIRAKEEQLTGKTQGTILERRSASVHRHHGPVEVPND